MGLLFSFVDIFEIFSLHYLELLQNHMENWGYSFWGKKFREKYWGKTKLPQNHMENWSYSFWGKFGFFFEGNVDIF